MFLKIGILKNIAIFTGKHLCWSIINKVLFNKFIKKRLQHRCFPVNIANFLKTVYFQGMAGLLVPLHFRCYLEMYTINPNKFALTLVFLMASIDLFKETHPKRLAKNEIKKRRIEFSHF